MIVSKTRNWKFSKETFACLKRSCFLGNCLYRRQAGRSWLSPWFEPIYVLIKLSWIWKFWRLLQAWMCKFCRLCIHLSDFAFFFFQSSREQLAIAEFANSLLVIPKQLGVNAAQDSTELVAKLRAYHNMSQTKAEHADLKWWVWMETMRMPAYLYNSMPSVFSFNSKGSREIEARP